MTVDLDIPERVREVARQTNDFQRRNKPQWRSNWAANWPKVKNLPGVFKWFKRFRGVPAVVVNAGPSLDKALEPLREFQDRYLIIVVDAAYQKVVDAGIDPDVTITLDSSEHTGIFFEKHRSGDLVALCPIQHPGLVNSIPASDIAPYTTNAKENALWWELINSYMSGKDNYFGRLFSGGSVGTVAGCLATFLMCDPIIMVGLDLSFQKPEQRRNDQPLVETEDIFGNKVLTMKAFLISRDWYQELCFRDRWLEGSGISRPRWINATGGGILRKNCELTGPGILEELVGPEINHKWHLRKRLKKK